VNPIVWPIVVSIAAWVATLAWCATVGREDDRQWKDFIDDIRAMNQYNSYLLAAIVIFLGFVQARADSAGVSRAVTMLLIAFSFGALSMFFFPIRKRVPGGTGSGLEPGLPVRAYWVLDLLASQATVVFAVFGLWTLKGEAM
jgi:hypothetical protein